MADIRTEHCVEIRVPLKNGKYCFGSGYTLGPHWVLTAYHVLFPDNLDDAQPIKVTWWDESEDTVKDNRPVARDEIVWFHQALDIALIKCESPYVDVPTAWEQIDQDRPTKWKKKKCQSAGFLSNLKNEAGNQRRKTPRGTFALFSEKATKADINGSDVQLEDDALWAGFSGSPVFAGGKLAAVVRTVNLGEDGAGLSASFISPALDVEGGKQQVRLRDVPEFLVAPGNMLWQEQLRAEVVKKLEHDKAVYSAIKAEYLKQEKDAVIRNESALVDALARAPTNNVINCFLGVFRSMEQSASSSGVEVMEYLARVWLTLVAAEQRTIDGIDTFKYDHAAEPLAVNAVEPELVDVEAQAAIGENCEPRLDLYGQRLRSPMDLTPDHNTGLDANDCQAAADVDLARRLKTQPGLEAFIDDVKNALEDRAIRPEGGLPVGFIASKNDKKRRYFISDQLDLNFAEKGRSVYIRIPKPVETDEPSALRDLHQWCPQLLIFEVTKNEEDLERYQYLTRLHSIIYRAKKFLDVENST